MTIKIVADSGVKLFCEPGKVYTWKEFIEQKPNYSVALDGFVNSKTQRLVNSNGPCANFDHHIGDRIATLATCEQIYLEITSGHLFDFFKYADKTKMNVFVNHPDEDTSLSYWLLKHHKFAENLKDDRHKLLLDLVDLEGKIDSTSGTYSMPKNLPLMRKLAWIFEPYTNYRFNKEKSSELRKPEIVEKIINNISKRINNYLNGESSEIDLNGTYEIIGNIDRNNKWFLIEETGPGSRQKFYSEDGNNAYISFISKINTNNTNNNSNNSNVNDVSNDSHYTYSIGKRSKWMENFDLTKIYRFLNTLEKKLGNEITLTNNWGGSNLCGGSPRATGSLLSPEDLTNALVDFYKNKNHK